MSMVAACPKCGLDNAPMNTVCDACGAALGTALSEPQDAPLMPWGSFVMSAGIKFAMGLVTAIADLPIAIVALSAFYGPLIASWRARQNVVGLAALGALASGAFMLVCVCIGKWESVKALLYAAIHATPQYVDDYDKSTHGTSIYVAFIFGSLVLAAVAAPTSLIGASVGEHLAARRRAAKL